MAHGRKAESYIAICCICLIMVFSGCAGGQATQQLVVTEFLLQSAGFQRWDVNMDTPKRLALMNSIPKGKITSYIRDGQMYHVYSDEKYDTLWVGDDLAYRRYLTLAGDKHYCERVTGTNSEQFWRCYDDVKGGPPAPR